MRPRVIEWDGAHVPEELRGLPPGRYLVEPLDEVEIPSPEEEAGILSALDALDAGRGVPIADVVREIRSGLPGR